MSAAAPIAATVAMAKIVLRIMKSLLGSYWMWFHILPVCRANDLSVQRRAEFVNLNRPFGDGHHKRERHLLAGADPRRCDGGVRQKLATRLAARLRLPHGCLIVLNSRFSYRAWTTSPQSRLS